MKQQSCKLGSATLIVAVLGSALSATAGSLTPPPGPIQPTNRVQINQQFGTLPIIIDQSGSYVLTGNILAPTGYTGNGIEINADDVTLDLNGFSVIGVAGSGDGINSDVDSGNTTVRNGSVLNWGGSGVVLFGIDGTHVCDSVRATNNIFFGINTGNANITRCVTSDNGFSGIQAGGVISISHCTANGNGDWGIHTHNAIHSRVVSCFANDNGLDGILGVGDVIDCHASGNERNGIRLERSGSVIRCTCISNGIESGSSSAGGIRIGSGFPFPVDTQVEGNHLFGNEPNGISVAGTGSTIIRNVVTGSTNPYVIAAGNDAGPIGTAATATSPWANITD